MVDNDRSSSADPTVTRTTYDTVTKSRLARKSPGGGLLAGAVIAPLALAGLAGIIGHGGVQDDLATRSTQALAAAGIQGAQVSFSGRDATVTLPDSANASQAEGIVKGVEGVRVVHLGGADASGGNTVPARPRGGGTSTNGASEGPSSPASGAACMTLQHDIDSAIDARKITFAPNSADMTSAGASTIAKVAELMKGCSTAHVVVGGHTDNQGDPSTSVPLSQERADAVRTLLITDGVPAADVTAKGYGESQPIAPNSTASGQAENRRITIKVQ